MSEYNDKCPFCGKKELVGTMTMTVVAIPLHDDGFNDHEGEVTENEFTFTKCTACGKEVSPDHYLHHSGGAPLFTCDCKEAAAKVVQQ